MLRIVASHCEFCGNQAPGRGISFDVQLDQDMMMLFWRVHRFSWSFLLAALAPTHSAMTLSIQILSDDRYLLFDGHGKRNEVDFSLRSRQTSYVGLGSLPYTQLNREQCIFFLFLLLQTLTNTHRLYLLFQYTFFSSVSTLLCLSVVLLLKTYLHDLCSVQAACMVLPGLSWLMLKALQCNTLRDMPIS
jgi:hypothetical protein